MSGSRREEIRRTGAYRAALWCVRSAFLWGVFWIVLVWIAHRSGV